MASYSEYIRGIQGRTVRCQRCKKPITGHYIRAFNRTWHRECFLCAGCNRPVTGEYIRRQGQPWHPHCFRQAFIPNCVVCEQPLTDRYLQDYWGNKYCFSHRSYAICTSCHRIVCGRVTGGGMRFPDGLTICNLCTATGITSASRAEQLAVEMRAALKALGLNLYQAETPVRLADRDELHSHSRHNNHEEHPLLGLAVWSTTYAGKRIVARQFREILVQKNLPEEHFRTVLIHELTHAWFFYHNPKGKPIPLQVEEGICVLVEYLWLKQHDTEDARYRRTIIEACQDPIYGVGFQKALKAKGLLKLSSLCRYVLENGKFPSWLGAFFYD